MRGIWNRVGDRVGGRAAGSARTSEGRTKMFNAGGGTRTWTWTWTRSWRTPNRTFTTGTRTWTRSQRTYRSHTKTSMGLGIAVGLLWYGVAGSTAMGSTAMRLDQKIPAAEVPNHNSIERGIWVVIDGKVYDLTEFINMHPGGASVIMKYAGKDATFLFKKIHQPGTLEAMLPEGAYLGELDGELDQTEDPMEVEERRSQEMRARRPPLMTILNLSEFEYVAHKILPVHAWAYYSGGSDDEVTVRENNLGFGRFFFKPKVLVDVDDVDITTTMLGIPTAAPFYCSAAALALLGHPDGELSIARGCFEENIIQMISSAASYPMDDIVDASDGAKWFQLYVKPDRKQSLATIDHCIDKGIKAIFVTVDTPLFGRREKDLRYKIAADPEDLDAIDLDLKDSNDFILSYDKIRLKWADIKTFKQHSSIPIVVKGVQRVEDVILAVENNADAVVLSNHGGRQLDYARPPVEVLAEVMPALRERNLQDKIEVYIDGGIRRGSDVLKALCLGAKGVGLGRPFLYANSGYGENGVIKACKLLKDEISRDMKLLGVTKVSELGPELLHAQPGVFGNTPNMVYEPLYLPEFSEE